MIKTSRTSHQDSTTRNDVHLPENLRALVSQKACQRLFMQLRTRLLWMSELIHSRTPDPTPSTRIGAFVSTDTQKRRLPSSVSPTEFTEFKETLPCRPVARECANCELRAVEHACGVNLQLSCMTEVTR